MKFISGIKKLNIQKGVTIEIPIYHRTSISFFNDSEVYYHYRTFESNNFFIRELILTPLKPEIWHHLRKVTINAIDRPGIINAITTKLKDLKINVNIVEALTTEIGAIHAITLIIDLSIYIEKHPKKYNSGDSIPKELIDELEMILKSITYMDTQEKVIYDNQVSITELIFLESISNTHSNPNSSFQFHLSDNNKVRMRNGRITLNENVIKGLALNIDSFYYTMFSDSEEKYIKNYFF